MCTSLRWCIFAESFHPNRRNFAFVSWCLNNKYLLYFLLGTKKCRKAIVIVWPHWTIWTNQNHPSMLCYLSRQVFHCGEFENHPLGISCLYAKTNLSPSFIWMIVSGLARYLRDTKPNILKRALYLGLENYVSVCRLAQRGGWWR